MRRYYVYIMASKCNKVLYIGFTNDLSRRAIEHKTHRNKGFSAEFKVTKLVYYEQYYYVNNAITREKQRFKFQSSFIMKQPHNAEATILNRLIFLSGLLVLLVSILALGIDGKFSTPGTANEKGTGLGLILCKEFVEKNGGTIWAESDKGKGSKFVFTVPTENN